MSGSSTGRPPLAAVFSVAPRQVSRVSEVVTPIPVARPTFREVYDQYFAFVWRSAAHRGVPSSALDDVVQEVFIVVDRKLPEFEGRSTLRFWIAGIVRKVVADFVRKRGNRQVADEPLVYEPASERELPPDELERRHALVLLDSILSQMSGEQREVFVLCEIEGLSGAEAAQLMELNENTLWTRLRAARRIFQEGVMRQRAKLTRQEP